jgi:hypothetical protein
MGGDSLSAVQLVNQINNTFGSSLTVTDLYKNASAAKIADKITSKRPTHSDIDWQKEWETNLSTLVYIFRPFNSSRSRFQGNHRAEQES